jgi:two-component system, sensor histidine kinase and response regulator
MRQILVIEDDPQLQALIKDALSNSEFNLTLARDGEQGVIYANQRKPDLIVTDIRMPGIDGFETMRQIRQNPELANVPFIFMTGLADSVNHRLSMNLGADDYLAKPFTIESLLAAINARMQKLISIERMTEAKLDALRKNIATSVPHEMKTPLSGIIGLIDLLIDDYPSIDPLELPDYFADIKTCATRLSCLIENYIEYARLESNPEILVEEVRLKHKLKLHQSWLQNIGETIAEKYKRLADLRIDEIEQVEVIIKDMRLFKILSELIDNAFKFSLAGTSVVIDSWTEIESNQITIQISDQGRGMSADEIKNIGAYTQFNRKIYEQQGGGMGLFLAKYLTESFNGSFSINSQLGEHTVVSVRLPLA